MAMVVLCRHYFLGLWDLRGMRDELLETGKLQPPTLDPLQDPYLLTPKDLFKAQELLKRINQNFESRKKFISESHKILVSQVSRVNFLFADAYKTPFSRPQVTQDSLQWFISQSAKARFQKMLLIVLFSPIVILSFLKEQKSMSMDTIVTLSLLFVPVFLVSAITGYFGVNKCLPLCCYSAARSGVQEILTRVPQAQNPLHSASWLLMNILDLVSLYYCLILAFTLFTIFASAMGFGNIPFFSKYVIWSLTSLGCIGSLCLNGLPWSRHSGCIKQAQKETESNPFTDE